MEKKYELTDEHRKELGSWADRWIKNAMSTKPMDEEERKICRKAVREMYQAANLTPPPDHRIVFVASPFVAKFAGGFAAAIWHKRKTGLLTYAATADATRDATDDATYAATRDATYAATDDATRAATRAATYEDKTKWYNFNNLGMLKLSLSLNLGKLGLMCANNTWRMYAGGNQWSGWVSFLSFFRHIAKLDIDYSKWDSYEKLTIHAGPRIMHKEFCIISDRPVALKVNERNQPHCFDGPFCQWSDGSAIYMMNGIRVPQWVAETKPEDFTRDMIIKEENADIRREMIRKIGMDRVAKLLDYKIIDSLDGYELITFDIGDGRIRPWLKMQNKSINICHIEGCPPETKTVQEAIVFRNTLSSFSHPEMLS